MFPKGRLSFHPILCGTALINWSCDFWCNLYTTNLASNLSSVALAYLSLMVEPSLVSCHMELAIWLNSFNVSTWRCTYFTKVAWLLFFYWFKLFSWNWTMQINAKSKLIVEFDHQYLQENNILTPRPPSHHAFIVSCSMPDKHWSKKDWV